MSLDISPQTLPGKPSGVLTMQPEDGLRCCTRPGLGSYRSAEGGSRCFIVQSFLPRVVTIKSEKMGAWGAKPHLPRVYLDSLLNRLTTEGASLGVP